MNRFQLNASINRNLEAFTPTDCPAAVTLHVADNGAQMVRYCCWYSKKRAALITQGRPQSYARAGHDFLHHHQRGTLFNRKTRDLDFPVTKVLVTIV